jgi:hypothetical protein
MWEMRSAYNIIGGKYYMIYFGVHGSIILKLILKVWDVKACSGFMSLGLAPSD